MLLDRIRGGDRDAMAELFDRYSPMLYSVALRILREPSQAEDVVQEILLGIWRKPAMFEQGRGSLGSWLLVVARNRAIDSLRRRRPSEPVEDVVLASRTDLASEAERNIAIEKVRKAMAVLPQEQRDSVELAYFEGLSHAEIAARTGDPLGTVKTRIRLALKSLRRALAT